jgi:hypothetical protein
VEDGASTPAPSVALGPGAAVEAIVGDGDSVGESGSLTSPTAPVGDGKSGESSPVESGLSGLSGLSTSGTPVGVGDCLGTRIRGLGRRR